MSLAEVGKFTFAVPAWDANPMLEKIAQDGSYTAANPRAWLGVTCYPVGHDVILAGALPGSPAEEAGLVPGDVIEEFEGTAIRDRRELYEAIWREQPGTTLRLRIRRGRDHHEVPVEASSIESFFAV